MDVERLEFCDHCNWLLFCPFMAVAFWTETHLLSNGGFFFFFFGWDFRCYLIISDHVDDNCFMG
jgi:hypothetical protein